MNDHLARHQKNQDKVFLENIRPNLGDKELETVADVYRHFYKWRDERSGTFAQLQYRSFEDMLAVSRKIFWNSSKTGSEDLEGLGLNFSMGFVRKEAKDFIGKLVSLNIKPRFSGSNLDQFGVKVLQAMYDKWRMHSNDRVEKFWELLYGIVNGTVCKFVGYNDSMTERKFLRSYNKKTGQYDIEKKDVPFWDDVWGEIVPIEDIYLSKLYERNIRKQGRLIWKTQMDWKDFQREFKHYDNAEYVYPGNRLADDSLYFKLLGGSGITTTSKVEILKEYDEVDDHLIITANGVWLNPMGNGKKLEVAPLPFNHKHLPFVWGILDPIDEKMAYGMPMPYAQKDPHKLLNTSYTMLMERELRTISPPILTSDIEAPDIIFGDQKVIPVNDVNAYKEMELQPAGNDYFATINNLQNILTSQVQGGSQIPGGKQPTSARQQLQLMQQQQVFMANTLLMYYDMVRQEIELMLKTAIQFYPMARYREHTGNIVRAINVPNTSLTGGGTGTMEVRITGKGKKATPVELFIEAVQKSIQNGNQTEIMEVPLEVFEELDFDISRIDLEPEQTSELEQQAFMERVFTPMMQVFAPMGLADPQKAMLRFLQKMKEHPADWMPDKILPQVYAAWKKQNTIPGMNMPQGQQSGAVGQSMTGIMNGGNGNQGMGGQAIGTPFGSQQASPIKMGQ